MNIYQVIVTPSNSEKRLPLLTTQSPTKVMEFIREIRGDLSSLPRKISVYKFKLEHKYLRSDFSADEHGNQVYVAMENPFRVWQEIVSDEFKVDLGETVLNRTT